ncbi:TIC 21, chloroplastic-like protein [Drosera capensis]
MGRKHPQPSPIKHKARTPTRPTNHSTPSNPTHQLTTDHSPCTVSSSAISGDSRRRHLTMQALLLPSALSPPPSPSAALLRSLLHRLPSSPPVLSFAFTPTIGVSCNRTFTGRKLIEFPLLAASVSPGYAAASPNPPVDESEQAKLAQVAKRLESTARYFKRLGSFGFWSQLVSTVVAAVILSFSIVVTGKITSPFTFYTTAAGIVVAFISVFWSFSYLRLSEKLRKTANEPSKAPPRADVVKSLKNGIVLNIIGMSAAILGMQATVGLLVGKALTSSSNPYYQGISPGYSPVLALDVFLIQASANTILSHFFGLVSSLELLRSVTLPPPQPVPLPKIS